MGPHAKDVKGEEGKQAEIPKVLQTRSLRNTSLGTRLQQGSSYCVCSDGRVSGYALCGDGNKQVAGLSSQSSDIIFECVQQLNYDNFLQVMWVRYGLYSIPLQFYNRIFSNICQTQPQAIFLQMTLLCQSILNRSPRDSLSVAKVSLERYFCLYRIS